MAEDLFGNTEAVQGLTTQMVRLDAITTQFGKSLSKALAAGIIQGKSFDDILRTVGERLLTVSLNAAYKPLTSGISSALGGLTQSATSLLGSVLGGSFGGGGFSDFFGGGGPSGDGPLGGGGNTVGAAGGVTVNMAVSTPDAESFQRSESQISAALARAVARGQRSL